MAEFHKIQKLKGAENYKPWEVAVRSALIINKLWAVTKETYQPPESPDSNGKFVASKDPEGVFISNDPDEDIPKRLTPKQKRETWEKYEENNDTALASIQIACGDGPYAQIEYLRTAREVWVKLKELFGTETYASIKAVYFALHTLRSDQFKDLYAYLAKFKELSNKLHQNGDPICLKYLAMIFERGLPEHLAQTVFTHYEIARSRGVDIDFDYITTSIVSGDQADKINETKAYAGNFGKQAKPENNNSRSSSRNPRNNFNNQNAQPCGVCFSRKHVTDKCYHGKNKYNAPEGFKPISNERKRELQEQYHRSDKSLYDRQDQARSARLPGTKNKIKSSDFIIDSGDQEHICWDRSRFSTYVPVTNHIVTGINNNTPFTVRGVGTVILPAIVGDQVKYFEITNVRHTPDVDFNLLSTTQLDLAGYHHTGGNGRKTFYNKHNEVVLQGYLSDRTYLLETMWAKSSRALRLKSSVPAKNDASWTTWHKRFGHISIEATKALAKDTGVDCDAADRLQKFEANELCEECISGKIHRTPSRIPMTRTSIKGQAWHVDLVSASHVETLGGHLYVMAMTDEATGMTYLEMLSRRSEIASKLEFKIKNLTNQGIKVAFIRSDNELANNDKCQQVYRQYGIQFSPSAPYNPHQNGIAERKNRTLMSRVRTVLIDAGLPQAFWGEAIYYVNYIENLVPRKDKSAFEVWYGYKPEGTYLKPFGCWCYSYDNDPHKKKLDNKAIKARFLGHEGKSIYRVWDIKKERVIRSAHVIFDEYASMPSLDDEIVQDDETDEDYLSDLLSNLAARPSSSAEASNQSEGAITSQLPDQSEGVNASENSELSDRSEGADVFDNTDNNSGRSEIGGSAESPDALGQIAVNASNNPPNIAAANNDENTNEAQLSQTVANPASQSSSLAPRNRKQKDSAIPEPSRRSARDTKKIDYGQTHKRGLKSKDNPDGFRALFTRLIQDKEKEVPSSMNEALRGPDSEHWRKAAEEEMANHQLQSTWNEPCVPPPNAHVLSGRWVLSYKFGPMGEIVKYKARWVVKGFQQIEGIDYLETFSSTLKVSSWRTLIALIAKYNLFVECSDVVAAFLASLVHEEIWVEQPHGFSTNKNFACKLNKALYGLKQASHEWYETLYSSLKALGFQRTESDHSVFINHRTSVIIAAYVDDLLFIAKNQKAIDDIKEQLDKRFNFKHLGPLKTYLGMQVVRNLENKTIQVNQSTYTKQLLTQLGMANCSSVKSPMEQARLPSPPDGFQATSDETSAYQSLVGALNWLSIMTRPDITYAVSKLGRHLANPMPAHMTAAKRVLRYLSGTIDHGLFFGPGPYDGLEGFSDASYCDDFDTSRSTEGYIFKLFNGPIVWHSKLQELVATSTCESEYMAACSACKQAIYLSAMIQGLGFGEGNTPVSLNVDNQAAMKLATNPINHSATKHIRMRFHFVRQTVSETKEIKMRWVDTNGQAADPFTKPLGPNNFGHARDLLGLAPSKI